MRKWFLPLVLVIVLVVIVMLLIRQAQQRASGRGANGKALTSPPDFVGWVLAVDSGSGQIVVESQADKIVRRVTVTLTKDTLIFRREGEVLRQVDFSEVRPKDQAQLWLIGRIPSSFPAQVTVQQVIVEKLY